MPAPAAFFSDALTLRLCEAAMMKSEAEVREVLRAGASFDTRGVHGVTPLQWSIVDGQLAATAVMLAAGASPDVRDDEGHTAMEWGARVEDPELLRLLLAHGGDANSVTHRGEPVLLAAAGGLNLEHVELLLDHGARIDATGILGQTAAMRLAIMSQFEEVERLLSRGADHLVVDDTGGTLAYYTQDSRVESGSIQAAARERVLAVLSGSVSLPVRLPREDESG